VTDDLVTWLRIQIDADERIARAATEGPWIAEVSGETGHCVIPADAQSTREHVAKTQLYAAAADAEHIARHDPARVLAEVDAKRRILAEHPIARGVSNQPVCATCATRDGYGDLEGDWPCQTARLLALPHAERDGYRDEWRTA